MDLLELDLPELDELPELDVTKGIESSSGVLEEGWSPQTQTSVSQPVVSDSSRRYLHVTRQFGGILVLKTVLVPGLLLYYR